MIEIENLYDYSVVPEIYQGIGIPLPRETRIKNLQFFIDNCIHRLKTELSESLFNGFGAVRMQVVNGSGIEVIFMFIIGTEFRQKQAQYIVENEFDFTFLLRIN